MLDAAFFALTMLCAAYCGSGGYLYLPWAWSYLWTR